jgi:AbrB family looped-hinge helix DNA binding protein
MVYSFTMNESTIQIDQAGRIVLPKRLRERFHLRGGDTLAIEVRGEAIELRPTQPASRLERVNGVLVFTGGIPLQAGEDLVVQSREERIDELTHGAKTRR